MIKLNLIYLSSFVIADPFTNGDYLSGDETEFGNNSVDDEDEVPLSVRSWPEPTPLTPLQSSDDNNGALIKDDRGSQLIDTLIGDDKGNQSINTLIEDGSLITTSIDDANDDDLIDSLIWNDEDGLVEGDRVISSLDLIENKGRNYDGFITSNGNIRHGDNDNFETNIETSNNVLSPDVGTEINTFRTIFERRGNNFVRNTEQRSNTFGTDIRKGNSVDEQINRNPASSLVPSETSISDIALDSSAFHDPEHIVASGAVDNGIETSSNSIRKIFNRNNFVKDSLLSNRNPILNNNIISETNDVNDNVIFNINRENTRRIAVNRNNAFYRRDPMPEVPASNLPRNSNHRDGNILTFRSQMRHNKLEKRRKRKERRMRRRRQNKLRRRQRKINECE